MPICFGNYTYYDIKTQKSHKHMQLTGIYQHSLYVQTPTIWRYLYWGVQTNNAWLCWITVCTLPWIRLHFWPTASVYLTTWGKVPSKETLVYNQSQRLGSWMLGYTMWAPFSHHAIFSRHQCLPAKITWIWIVCSAVQSGLQQESDDSDRQSACIQCVCTLDHYWHIVRFSSNKIPKSCWQ